MQRKGRPHKLQGGKRYALYLDAPTIEMLRGAARARGCSISQLVRKMAQEYLSKETDKQDGQDSTLQPA